MKSIKLLCILLILGFAAGCASTPADGGGDSQEIAAAAGDPASSEAPLPGDTSEADLSMSNPPPPGEKSDVPPPGQSAPPAQAAAPAPAPATQAPSAQDMVASLDQPDAQAPGAPAPVQAPETPTQKSAPQGDLAQNPTPEAAPEAAPPAQAEAPAPAPVIVDDSGPAAQVTALDFKSNVNGGTVVLKTNRPVEYATRKNEKSNQYVIELKNTTIPAQFQRPYDTKEFSGPIASINAYQAKGAYKMARIVIQLRDNVEPGVSQNGSVISIAGNGTGTSPDVAPAVATNNNQGANADTETAEVKNGSDEIVLDGSEKSLKASTVSDFILGTNNKFYGRPISLELKDADIRDVFAFISEESGLNIVVGDDVVGKVTVKLRKIPWDQALLIVMQSKALGYVRQGKILRVATLKTLQAESDAAKNVVDSQRLLQPLRTQVFPISYANATDLELQAKDFLSSRGKTKADKRTNNLVVTDIEENLVRVKALVKRLDTQTPEVLIESKIVEARETYNKVVGVNWNFSGSPVNTSIPSSQGAVTLTPNLASGSSVSNPFMTAGFSLGTLDVFGDLTASLQLLETEGLAKVLSAPRIVTLDRQEADIQQTTQYPVFSSTTTPAVSTGAVPTTTSTVTFQDVKLELKVRPQITVDGSVIMDLDVLREYADPVTQVGASQARAINKRQAKTQVLVENGDTVVIGGIYQNDVTDSTTGVPWLSKIPVLGALFRTSNLTREKNELVIFLTPRILNREKAFAKTPEGVAAGGPG